MWGVLALDFRKSTLFMASAFIPFHTFMTRHPNQHTTNVVVIAFDAILNNFSAAIVLTTVFYYTPCKHRSMLPQGKVESSGTISPPPNVLMTVPSSFDIPFLSGNYNGFKKTCGTMFVIRMHDLDFTRDTTLSIL